MDMPARIMAEQIGIAKKDGQSFGVGRWIADEAAPNATTYVRADLHDALAAECGGYLAVWAVRHAEMNGLPEGEIHPQHFDRMAELGCRMDAFTRAAMASIKGIK